METLVRAFWYSALVFTSLFIVAVFVELNRYPDHFAANSYLYFVVFCYLILSIIWITIDLLRHLFKTKSSH